MSLQGAACTKSAYTYSVNPYSACLMSPTESENGTQDAPGARPLTDGERVDRWALRISDWSTTLADAKALISSLPEYVDCGVLRSHRIIDYFVRAYVVFIATEPMPYSVYERLARRRVCVDNHTMMEEVELKDWIQDMHSWTVVHAYRERARP